MSVLNIGMDDVSDETRNLKDKLSSKGIRVITDMSLTLLTQLLECQISAQQMKLMKQAAEFDELQSTLNDALHKVCGPAKFFPVILTPPSPAVPRNQPCT